jgi:hypothetical protein
VNSLRPRAPNWLLVEPGYLAVALPKLNVVAVNKLFRLFHSLGIVSASSGTEL